ncbi:MAG: thiamine-phosphate kinase [Candidatus Eisenbacteria bacterium]|nr:thiamine-phosphate kinase [Candidatus Latescibacterota bacterium]MBD3301453.1 thiamine-phosphate kinase [Candidatus Eisenbacteria bacterium]
MKRSPGWSGSKGTPIAAVGEFGLIDRLHRIVEEETARLGVTTDSVSIGIGDDTAAIRPSPGFETLVTCDIQVDGRHFLREWITPHDLGARIGTINLSDIAAMGGIPRAAIVSLAIGPGAAVEDLEELYRGLTRRLGEHGATLIGGNVSGISEGLILDLTLLGEVEIGRAVRRSGVAPGQIVWATGMPGASAAGFALLQAGWTGGEDGDLDALISAYLHPVPRVAEGRRLGETGLARAMIDLSDGLVGDLRHLVERRPFGILLRAENLPIGEELRRAAIELGRSPQSFLLEASDDYELLFTTDPDAVDPVTELFAGPGRPPVQPIGEVVGDFAGEVVLEDVDGRIRPASPTGWDHFPSGG